MSKIPRPGEMCPSTDAMEKENTATNDGAPTVASGKLDQAWSPPPARPLGTVDTNTKSTKRCVVDEERDARNTKQKVVDEGDSAVPLETPPLLTSCVDVPAEELELWLTTRQETGWQDKDCLEHKLSLPKKVDAQKKVATLGQHVKRLRALGWTLYGQRNEAMSASGAAKDKLESVMAELDWTKASLEELSATLGAEVEASRATILEQTERMKDLAARREEVEVEVVEVVVVVAAAVVVVVVAVVDTGQWVGPPPLPATPSSPLSPRHYAPRSMTAAGTTTTTTRTRTTRNGACRRVGAQGRIRCTPSATVATKRS